MASARRLAALGCGEQHRVAKSGAMYLVGRAHREAFEAVTRPHLEEVRASLAESHGLAEKLGLNGTPSYVIGTEVVVGAVGFGALKEKISVARACTASGSC